MQIETINIHIASGPSAISKALIEAILRGPVQNGEDSPAPADGEKSPIAVRQQIGAPWPGIAGIYAGVSRGEDGKPDAHLVLLDAVPEGELNWKDATAWAEGLGDGARLPTRFESALLYANLRDQIDTAGWYWTGTQTSAYYAWLQYFTYGLQSLTSKGYEGRARAVRRLEI